MTTLSFTVFTPTFNRREQIARAYRSLCAQTLREFEWLVVDDGSTDDTASLFREWRRTAPFAIRYVYGPNRGKHRAYNDAIRLARGELFTVVDSDDTIVPSGLERLLFHWNSIPQSARPRYSGVTCLSMNEQAHLVGRPFPADVLDCRHYEGDSRFGAVGEKWGCHRTAILREFPFPEVPSEKYCPDALVWNRIARHYLVRHVNECLRIYSTAPDGLMANRPTVMIESPRSARMYYREYLELDVPLDWLARRAVNYVRFSLHARVPPARIVAESSARVLTAAVALPGLFLYGVDRLRRVPRHPRRR